MVPASEIVNCLLCRGVMTFSEEAQDSIYRDHLKREHRAYFNVNWIVRKTLKEAENKNKNANDIRNYLKKKSSKIEEVKTKGQIESGSGDTTFEISSFTDSEGQIEDLAQNENDHNPNVKEGTANITEDLSIIDDATMNDSKMDDTEHFTDMEDSIDNFTLESCDQSKTVNSFDDSSAEFMDSNNSTFEASADLMDMDESDSEFMNNSTLELFNDSNGATFDDSSFDDSNADFDDSLDDDSMLNSHLLESEESNEETMGTTVTLSDLSVKRNPDNVPQKTDSSNETIEISSIMDSEGAKVPMQPSDNIGNSISDTFKEPGDGQEDAEKNLVSNPSLNLNDEPVKNADIEELPEDGIHENIEDDIVDSPEEDGGNSYEDKENIPYKEDNDASCDAGIGNSMKDCNEDQFRPILAMGVNNRLEEDPTVPKESIESRSHEDVSTIKPSNDISTEANGIPREDDVNSKHGDINDQSGSNEALCEEEISPYPSEDGIVESNQMNEELNNDAMTLIDDSRNVTCDWDEENYVGTGEEDISYPSGDAIVKSCQDNNEALNEELNNDAMLLNDDIYNETEDAIVQSNQDINDESFDDTMDETWNEEINNDAMTLVDDSYNETGDWDDQSYAKTGDSNEANFNVTFEQHNEGDILIDERNKIEANEPVDLENYNDIGDINEESFNETGFWNGKNNDEQDTSEVDNYEEMANLNEKSDEDQVDVHMNNEHADISRSVAGENVNLTENQKLANRDQEIIDNLSNQSLEADNGELTETEKNNDIPNGIDNRVNDLPAFEKEVSKKRHLAVNEEEMVPKKIAKTENIEAKECNSEGMEEKPEKSPLHERKNFACEQCAKRYVSNYSLERHRSVCKGLKIRPCKQKDCEETFASRDDLKLHQKVHDGDILKRVHDGADLTKDGMNGAEIKNVSEQSIKDEKIEKVKDEKPFGCDFCPKRFKTKWYAQMHKETKHKKC